MAEAKLLEEPIPPVEPVTEPEIAVDVQNELFASEKPEEEQTLEEIVRNDILQDVLLHSEFAAGLEDEEFEESVEMADDAGNPSGEERSSRKTRARGDTERLLPPRRRGQDYFNRDLTQVLEGEESSTVVFSEYRAPSTERIETSHPLQCGRDRLANLFCGVCGRTKR